MGVHGATCNSMSCYLMIIMGWDQENIIHQWRASRGANSRQCPVDSSVRVGVLPVCRVKLGVFGPGLRVCAVYLGGFIPESRRQRDRVGQGESDLEVAERLLPRLNRLG